jgi:formamidopyrimidine-DNA glycosylase
MRRLEGRSAIGADHRRARLTFQSVEKTLDGATKACHDGAMPELPEVETVRRGLETAMLGRRIEKVRLNRGDLRVPFPRGFARRLAGRHVETVGRRAKYLLVGLDGGDSLLMHLGMSGRFTVHPPSGRPMPLGEDDDAVAPAGPPAAPSSHDHVAFLLDDGTRIVYTDPRRFGLMDIIDTAAASRHPLLDALGPEPLGNDFNAEYLRSALAGRRTPLKSALLDQHMVAGLGNIYACEALHRAALSPKRIAATVTRGRLGEQRLEALARAVRGVLGDAIAAGGSTLRDYASAQGRPGAFQHRFDVYDREGEPCPRPGCRGIVRRIVQAGRSTFYCAVCQR